MLTNYGSPGDAATGNSRPIRILEAYETFALLMCDTARSHFRGNGIVVILYP